MDDLTIPSMNLKYEGHVAIATVIAIVLENKVGGGVPGGFFSEEEVEHGFMGTGPEAEAIWQAVHDRWSNACKTHAATFRAFIARENDPDEIPGCCARTSCERHKRELEDALLFVAEFFEQLWN